ncbi:alpha/beta fold hydrolase [Kribbella yunnanensis]|uniref:Alpha/beta fold hydrolase n=1 Tax=Kribbella yunnanensis TaxID=190194 RepID=A0ABP4SJZ1_9ACTN
MSTFALIHGAGVGGGWFWHLVEAELQALGHTTVAPTLWAGDESETLSSYADTVVDLVGTPEELVVVAHSFGGFTAPLVAARTPTAGLVYVTAMVPQPGESPDEWWTNTGYSEAVRIQAARDGGLTGSDDPSVCYFHDVPKHLADQVPAREPSPPSNTAYYEPWPLDAHPATPTRYILCTEDRLFPAEFQREFVRERLGITPDEIASGHAPALSRPAELAAMLDGFRFLPESRSGR